MPEIEYKPEILDFLNKVVAYENNNKVDLDELIYTLLPSQGMSMNMIRDEVLNKTEFGINFYKSIEDVYQLLLNKSKKGI